jgi:hypothetical protein
MQRDDRQLYKNTLQRLARFAGAGAGIDLRRYQQEAGEAIVQSVRQGRGDSLVVMLPRQSGKNELQAQVEAFLLYLYHRIGGDIVKVSPTFKPQTQNAMRRLEGVLENHAVLKHMWRKESGYVYRVGRARVIFLSGDPNARVVGATASLLLECDEAQDVGAAKWDKDFAPMAASTRATRVFWGTSWTSQTLLARELRAARQAERQDGRRRTFVCSAEQVGAEVPAYAAFVQEQVARFGRSHPLVRTQYFSEEIDEQAGMFPAERLALMQGSHAREARPQSAGAVYALLVDVAGGDEAAAAGALASALSQPESRRDLTACTVVRLDLSTLADELLRLPTYRVVQRYAWVDVRHTELYAVLKALAEHWQARRVVIDATGVGAGLASFLEKALPGVALPFTFTSRSKSDLGWGFLAAIESGRYKEYTPADELQRRFWDECRYAEMSVQEGPGKLMRWGASPGARHPASGAALHDDLLISAALCAELDRLPWGLGESQVVQAPDPLEGLRDVY